jgi:hypothetical protein
MAEKGEEMKRVTKRELALSLHAAGRTVEEIADVLETRPDVVSAWLGVGPYVSLSERLRNRSAAYTAMLSALRALQDPAGHIWHGPGGECTGECRDVMEAVMLGEAAK